MLYRKLGNTGREISVVGFGGMRFFDAEEPTAIATVQACLDAGINFFETGKNYGEGKSEILIGRALKGRVERDDIVLANKVPVSDLPDGPTVRRALEEALRREQTEYFDLFSFWGTNTPQMFRNLLAPQGPLDALIKARDAGLIRGIGFTTHAKQDWILRFAEEFTWDAVTLKEHLLYSRQQEVIRSLGERSIAVIVMSPLAGGVVASPGPDIARRLAGDNLTGARLGLRYLISNPHVTSAISGMTRVEEVMENSAVGDTAGPLGDREMELIDEVRERTTALGEKFCTSCGYCVPCPEEVNIPGIFRLWNLMRGWGNREYSALEYLKLRERRHWADFPGYSQEACIQCGECEAKCPESLPIIEDLRRAHADLVADEA